MYNDINVGGVTTDSNSNPYGGSGMLGANAAKGSIGGYSYAPGTKVINCGVEVRMGFLRRVYGLLCVQLTIVAIICFLMRDSKEFVLNHVTLYYASLIGAFILMIPLFIFRKKHPVNLIFLFIFSAAFGYVVGAVTSQYAPNVVAKAAVITLSIFVALTLYTMQSKRDWSAIGGVLFTVLFCMILIGFMSWFWPFSKPMYMVYCGLGAVLFSFFIIYDTHRIMKILSPDEYIDGCVNLFLDVVNLFLFILSLLGGGDS